MTALIPGLPALPPGVNQPVLTLLASEAISSLLFQASLSPPAWGVFDSQNNQLLFPDSVLEFSHRQEYEISNFPVQDGSFASYNKVIRPFEIQLRFSKAGTATDRTAFLQSLDLMAAALTLVNVVTPDRTYLNVNLQRYEVVRRGAKGAYFLTEVDAYFIQILQVAAQYLSADAITYDPYVSLPNSQSEAAEPVTNVGNVQLQLPTPGQQQDGTAALFSLPNPSSY